MKHLMMSSAWEFSADPFPAFRCALIFGRNKRDREFLPVAGVTPITTYTVVGGYGTSVLYEGTDRAAAEAAKTEYEAAKKAAGEYGHASLNTGSSILPENSFRVIKTREKGTLMVVSGEDTTNRALMFIGCAGGFRGGVSLVAEGTTGQVLKTCHAGNNCESAIEVIALLEVGQSVAFHSSGRRTDEVHVFTWDGTQVNQQHYSAAEWAERTAVAAPPENGEVL